MADADSFADFLRRIRAGDAAAAAELFRRSEPMIRLEVRLRLRDPRLRRFLDESDVCQSVLASFFVRAAAGQFDLDRPEQLIGLLAGMARNKAAAQARRHRAERRDCRRDAPLDAELHAPAARGPSPSEPAVMGELLEQFRARLSDEERRLADLRAAGVAWAEVAAEMGGSPDGRRVQLDRAVRRVSRELGLEPDADE
jgi:RNA polymerase sigma-70 factor (ECF subfamily)